MIHCKIPLKAQFDLIDLIIHIAAKIIMREKKEWSNGLSGRNK